MNLIQQPDSIHAILAIILAVILRHLLNVRSHNSTLKDDCNSKDTTISTLQQEIEFVRELLAAAESKVDDKSAKPENPSQSISIDTTKLNQY